jgi:hypothetical protein
MLFQPQRGTRQLLPLLLAVTGGDRPGPSRTGIRRVAGILRALVTAFPWAGLIGAAPGVVLAVFGVLSQGWKGWLLFATGIVLLLFGWAITVLVRLYRKFTVHVPTNLFGICRGLGSSPDRPGFADWLSHRVDDLSGLTDATRPLRFGQLWTGTETVGVREPADRDIDLRMVTTCLTEGRPYEMPWEARRFFYDPDTWKTLFPSEVVQALQDAPAPSSPDGDDAEWRWEEDVASKHQPPLRRLPGPEHLPVIVATRLSLSFPLLISAIPLWTINRRDAGTKEAVRRYGEARKAGTSPPDTGLRFSQQWFTDGGFCSNFPLYLFDAALASRPTFAINLGRFSDDATPSSDQRENVEWATNNRALLPSSIDLPTRGVGAVGGFASAAINTARNWQDGSLLDQPGYRDRVVRVLQTKKEGGLNLWMDAPTIRGLSERGRTAGAVMVEQFTLPHYPASNPTATGWDNHRWVRYRSLLAALPDWLASYARGRAALQVNPEQPPSYTLTEASRDLAAQITTALDHLADITANADDDAFAKLEEAPRPKGVIRRIAQI